MPIGGVGFFERFSILPRIRPYADEGAHEVPNGPLLRSDIHRLFDRGYVTVTPDHRFRVSERLRDHYANGKTYYALHDRRIVTPSNPAHLPSREALAWHAGRGSSGEADTVRSIRMTLPVTQRAFYLYYCGTVCAVLVIGT